MTFITLSKENILHEHICCAFSDKKCTTGYMLKKLWLTKEFENGYVFRRLDEHAKVFLEYGPSEKAWMPILAPNTLALGCFWVAGRYKGKGYGRALLESAIADAKAQGKDGLVTVAGTRKFHFMSDTRWLLEHGFVACDQTNNGFGLLWLNFNPAASAPRFAESVRSGECPDKEGIVAYYSNRCPFCEFYVRQSLAVTAANRGLPLKIIKLDSLEAAQGAPTPATIFSLFKDGKFVTTDLSICMDSRFDKIVSS
jgi:hypothetical protein